MRQLGRKVRHPTLSFRETFQQGLGSGYSVTQAQGLNDPGHAWIRHGTTTGVGRGAGMAGVLSSGEE